MIIDIVIGAIIILFTALGFRSGFVRSFMHMAGWILAGVLGFVWFPRVKEFLMSNTDFYDSIYDKIYEKSADSMSVMIDTFKHLPSVFSKGLTLLTEDFTAAEASWLSNLIFTILSFLAVILIIKLAFILITSILSKKHNDGLTGFTDGILGAVFGLIKGVLIVFILLAFAIPLIGLSNPEHAQTIMDAIYNSELTLVLYDNNLLMLVVEDIIA